MIIVDTSVWIEYFSRKSKIPQSTLDELDQWIEDGVVGMLKPIEAELKAGVIQRSKRSHFERVTSALERLDPDWNSLETWDTASSFVAICRKKSLPLPGLIDRLILTSCKLSGAQLFTLDLNLARLARAENLAVMY